jgi:purine-nucleoside phosphorylase
MPARFASPDDELIHPSWAIRMTTATPDTQSPDTALSAAVAILRGRIPTRPCAGIILGSGLGGLADEIAEPTRIDYADLPGFARSTAGGHRGQLIGGYLDDVPVIAMAGRMHRYEGYGEDDVAFPVRVMAALGTNLLIVSNAAGGLNPVLEVGDIVVIDDHIDLAKKRSPHFCRERLSRFGAPVSAQENPPEPRHPSRHDPNERAIVASPRSLYDPALARVALQAARAGDFQSILGVYIATLGPTYETRAEYRMMRLLGGDVVGMSTAPEVRTASELGMRVLGLSMVSNVARPDAPESTDHAEVLDAGRAAAFKLRKIVSAALPHAID